MDPKLGVDFLADCSLWDEIKPLRENWQFFPKVRNSGRMHLSNTESCD